jgi:hypothetical protein
MKKMILVVALLSMLLIASDDPVRTIRLTIINKSGMDIAVQLIDGDFTDYDNIYYFKVEEGDRFSPTEAHFDIVPGLYNMQVYYLETWDPVYGFDCGPAAPVKLIARKNMKVSFGKCGQMPPNWGEPTMTKYWYWIFPPWKSRQPGYLY